MRHKSNINTQTSRICGGEGGIRTLGSLLGYGALAKLCFQPLSHLTKNSALLPLRSAVDGLAAASSDQYEVVPEIVNPANPEQDFTQETTEKTEIGFVFNAIVRLLNLQTFPVFSCERYDQRRRSSPADLEHCDAVADPSGGVR